MEISTNPLHGLDTNTRVEYPGFIPRQSLVDFCRSKVVEIQDNIKALNAALDNPACRKGAVAGDEFDAAMSMSIGQQTALRWVTEWAASHQVPDLGAQKYGAGHA